MALQQSDTLGEILWLVTSFLDQAFAMCLQHSSQCTASVTCRGASACNAALSKHCTVMSPFSVVLISPCRYTQSDASPHTCQFVHGYSTVYVKR